MRLLGQRISLSSRGGANLPSEATRVFLPDQALFHIELTMKAYNV